MMATPNLSRPDTPQQEDFPIQHPPQPQPQPQSQSGSQSQTSSMSQTQPTKPFPSITGSCICNAIQYRLLSAPLYVYACHCTDCQKSSGTAFGTFLSIERSNIQLLTPTQPIPLIYHKTNGTRYESRMCPHCHSELWTHVYGPPVASVMVGTLDFAGLFEPDLHAFTLSKVDWVQLPEGARTCEGQYDYRDYWPRASMRRLERCKERWALGERERVEKALEVAGAHVPGRVEVRRGRGCGGVGKDEGEGEEVGKVEREEGVGDGDKTPTPSEFAEEDGEDYEVFKKRCREMERALQARLERLRRKLEEEDERRQRDLEKLTENLAVDDAK